MTASSGSTTNPAADTESNLFLFRLRGQRGTLPPRASTRQIVLAGLGGMAAIGLVATLTSLSGFSMLLGSFGASCVLIFGFPDSPFSQPRNVILGHLICSSIGLLSLKLFGPHAWGLALAAGFSIAAMLLTRTVHPPAGSNPVIVFLSQPGWSFLLFPTLVGALLLIAVASIYLNLTQKAVYPKYWWGRNS